MPAPRWWESGYKSRVGGFGRMDGELPTGILADEILTPGKGRVRALVVHGGNPASSIPDTKKVVRALESLELLVAIEPFMSMTAELAHYVNRFGLWGAPLPRASLSTIHTLADQPGLDGESPA